MKKSIILLVVLLSIKNLLATQGDARYELNFISRMIKIASDNLTTDNPIDDLNIETEISELNVPENKKIELKEIAAKLLSYNELVANVYEKQINGSAEQFNEITSQTDQLSECLTKVCAQNEKLNNKNRTLKENFQDTITSICSAVFGKSYRENQLLSEVDFDNCGKLINKSAEITNILSEQIKKSNLEKENAVITIKELEQCINQSLNNENSDTIISSDTTDTMLNSDDQKDENNDFVKSFETLQGKVNAINQSVLEKCKIIEEKNNEIEEKNNKINLLNDELINSKKENISEINNNIINRLKRSKERFDAVSSNANSAIAKANSILLNIDSDDE